MEYMNKIFIAVALGLVVFLAGCAAKPDDTPDVTPTGVKYDVEMLPTGFSPNKLNISIGDAVVFVNKDTVAHRPASGQHPTHNIYPEPGGCIGSKFDACRNVLPGESFEFVFKYSGTWPFHDHLNATPAYGFGQIRVQ